MLPYRCWPLHAWHCPPLPGDVYFSITVEEAINVTTWTGTMTPFRSMLRDDWRDDHAFTLADAQLFCTGTVPAGPATDTLSGTITGGTGIFTNATGSYQMTLSFAGSGASTISISRAPARSARRTLQGV